MDHPDYEAEKVRCATFLENFVSDDDPEHAKRAHHCKYMAALMDISNRTSSVLEISMDDVRKYVDKTGETELMDNITFNTKRYMDLFAQAADQLMPDPTSEDLPEDSWDIIAKQRQQQETKFLQQRAEGMELDAGGGGAGRPAAAHLPPALMRRYTVMIQPDTATPVRPLRKVNAADVGHLVRVRGIVTNCTDVKPLITVATFLDEASGVEVYQEVTGKSFTPIVHNPADKDAKGVLKMQTLGSKFVKFQEARIQEVSEEVPQGCTPRVVTVHLRASLTRSLKPGDEVVVGGVFLPEPFAGFRGMKAGLIASTHLEATHVEQAKQSYADQTFTEKDRGVIEAIARGGEVYTRLARSIAPNIWGHEDVKKALLLTLVGGTTKALPDGMRLRGDIHLCLMGDPGVAKSQMLKFITAVSPRAVYTTGKGSSGVGLTAAVTRDRITGEMVLEGGALVLADRGVAAIDEFDKMEEGDRTAIHEVMEQQTVSIAKAGITTTLNTRTTILAAANPAWGRYDKRRTPSENINMPAALLSRFDVLWLLLDEVDGPHDKQLAEHVIAVHSTGVPPVPSSAPPLTPSQLRGYIAMAKRYEPVIPDGSPLEGYVAHKYAEMREEEVDLGAHNTGTYTTPRTLLALLRLSQALAKLRFDCCIIQSDVDEALELLRLSKSSLSNDLGERVRKRDPASLAYEALVGAYRAKAQAKWTWTDIKRLTKDIKGLTEEILEAMLEEYAAVSVWAVTTDRSGHKNLEFYPDEE